MSYKLNISNIGNQPITETIVLSCGGVQNSDAETEYSAYWRTTFFEDNILSTELTPMKRTYISIGLKHLQFYFDIFNFTQEQIKKINYKSLEGGNVFLKMAECLDFYDSIELEEFIIKIENKDFNN